MTQWVFKQTESQLWTVGYYDGDRWEPESDHGSPAEAGERVRILNGGNPADRELPALLRRIERSLVRTELGMDRLLDHLGLPKVTDAEVDAALAAREEQR